MKVLFFFFPSPLKEQPNSLGQYIAEPRTAFRTRSLAIEDDGAWGAATPRRKKVSSNHMSDMTTMNAS
jgi:hypothetical protein